MRSLISGGLFVAIAIAATSALALSSSSQARSLATCTPSTLTPVINNHTSQGIGSIDCQAGAPTWNYDVRLSNHAGSILAEQMGGPATGSSMVVTSVVNCNGAIVHSFLYINVGGAGKSSTSNEVQC